MQKRTGEMKGGWKPQTDGSFRFRGVADPLVTILSTTSDGPMDAFSKPQFDIDEIAAAVKKSLGYLEKPLIKCSHCGQWGAVYCACPSCGAPIDPE